MKMPSQQPRTSLAILIPCYNEETGIANVVTAFKRVLPHAKIYVYDNNSSDLTAQRAQEAGAIVRAEPKQGKGHVVRRMFSDIEADIYLMVDGDETYDASVAPEMVRRLEAENLDMIIAARKENTGEAYRFAHKFGNQLFNKALSLLFGSHYKDIFSGYRCFSKRFVKSFPALSAGFDIETELCIHSLEMGLPVLEIEAPFYERAQGSESKLSTVKDGLRILWRMFVLFKEVKPAVFFGLLFSFFTALSLGLGYPLINEYLSTGLVPRLPTAILTVGIFLLGFLSLICGLILDSVSRGRREVKRLHYLRFPSPWQD